MEEKLIETISEQLQEFGFCYVGDVDNIDELQAALKKRGYNTSFNNTHYKNTDCLILETKSLTQLEVLSWKLSKKTTQST